MRRITVLIASALINASTIPGLAAESTSNKDVNPALAVSATVHGKPANAGRDARRRFGLTTALAAPEYCRGIGW